MSVISGLRRVGDRAARRLRRAGDRAARGLGAAALIALVPAAGGAQDRALPAQLQPATRVALERVIDSARAAGLPVEPLISKAQEGVFRAAPEPRIVAAVERLARDLADSREALGAAASAEEITAGANALRAGVAPAELRRLRDARPATDGRRERPLTVALVVLADLATRGIPPSRAAASVHELVAREVTDDALIAFRQSVEHDLGAGRPPAAALDSRTRAILDGLRKP